MSSRSRSLAQPLVIGANCSNFYGELVTMACLWCWRRDGETGHWLLNFRLADDPSGYMSISVDMSLPTKRHIYQGNDNVNLYGQLSITARQNYISRDPLVHVEAVLTPQSNVTVKNIIDLITSNRLQYYKFHPHSSGCLFWQQKFLQLLIAQGWVEPRTASKLETEIEKYRARAKQNERTIPYPAVPGQFYDPTTLSASSV